MYKDISNKMLFGVCSGIADENKMDAMIVRIIFIVLAFMFFGIPIYLFLAFSLKDKKDVIQAEKSISQI